MENLMKKKWALYLLLIINLFFSSCLNPDKKEKITKEKFTKTFKELEYLKVRYEMGFLNDSIYNFEYNQIFTKNELPPMIGKIIFGKEYSEYSNVNSDVSMSIACSNSSCNYN